MKVNRGKSLERLVKTIEQSLLPEHFKVSANERIFNDAGVQIAEFDIIIEGSIGSSHIRWLIECRDRPSEGAAPASWIEQLVGRKTRFTFDKVFAVSTTGFAPDAKEFAKLSGIVLRSVESTDQIAQDFGIIEFRLQGRRLERAGDTICEVSDPKYFPLARSVAQRARSTSKIRKAGMAGWCEINQFMLDYLSDKKVLPNPDRDLTIDIKFECEDELEMLLDNGEILKMCKIEIPIRLHFEHFYTKTLSAKSYSEAGRVIGQEVAFTFDTPSGLTRCSAIILKKEDGDVEVKQYQEIEVLNG